MKKILSLFALLALFLIGGANKAVADDDLTGKSPVTELIDGGYYYIVNNADMFVEKNGKRIAFYYDDADPGFVYWTQINTSDKNFVFQLKKKSDNVWTIRNCASNQYVKGAAFEIVTFGLGEYEHTFYPQENGTSYKIRNASTGSTNSMYTDCCQYGASKKDKIGCNWWSTSTDVGATSNWDFYAVDANIAAEAEALGTETPTDFVTEIENGSYYYIINDYHAYNQKPDVDIAFWYDSDHLRWKQFDKNNYAQMFKVVKNGEGKIALQSVIGGKYVGQSGQWVDSPYYHTITDAADATYAPHLGAGTGLFKIVNTDGSGNPLGPGCIVCGDTRNGTIGQEGHTPDNSSYNSATKGFVGRWKFYKVPQSKTDALLYGIPITDLSQLSDDKYYYIISQHDDFRHLGSSHPAAQNYNGYEGMLGYDINVKNDNGDNVVAWVAAQRANPNPAVVWRITKDGDYYKLQNLYTGKYAGVAAYSRVSWTDECEKTQKFMTSNVAGAFEISNSDQNYRWGIGGSYHVANYGYVGSVGGTDQRNAWKVYELSDAQVQVMCDNMASELNAASSAFGYVNVMKDEASKDAAQALLAGNPTYEEMREAFKNVMPLTDGYYRLSYPKNYAGVLGEPYVFFGNDKLLNSNLSLDDAKADYSTVYKLTVEGNVTVPAGPGYVVTMESQGGLRPYYNGGYGDHKALDGNSAKARLIRPTGGFDDGGRTAFAIEVSQASGSFHNNYYLIKTADGTDNPVKAYYAGSSAVRLATSAQGYLYPATDITVKLNQAGDNYWATLYLPFGVTLPTGTEAYVGVVEDDKLKLTSIGQDIPAETPVVLCGDAATITATINDEIPEYTGTIGLSGQYLAADSRDDNIRSLGVKDGVVGFYKLPDSSTGLGANKALLNTGSGSQGYKIVIDDDVTAVNTAIINGQSSMVNDYYDLQGRKVAAPQKGSLYIKDGKVVKF